MRGGSRFVNPMFDPNNKVKYHNVILVWDKLDNDPEFLTSTLLYHLIDGKLSSKTLPEQTEAETLEGTLLHVNLYLRSKFFKVRSAQAKNIR